MRFAHPVPIPTTAPLDSRIQDFIIDTIRQVTFAAGPQRVTFDFTQVGDQLTMRARVTVATEGAAQ